MLSPDSRKEALRRDDQDPLADFRDHFSFPTGDDGEPLIYFCGNSLGLQPEGARQKVAREMDDWADRAVAGHFEGDTPWVSFNERLEGPVADIVGASTDEIALSNTLTANLHLMMVSFYRPTEDRYKILVEGGAFPSDQYAVKSQADYHGFDPEEAIVEVEPRQGEDVVRTEDIVAKIDELGDELALTMFTGVHYYTGQAFDLPAITEAAHDVGAFAGFDLAHAVGNVPLELHDSGADFAVWCHYKYMNAGPGAVGGYFVHDRHADTEDIPRFEGWWGNDPETRFEMKPEFEPQHGAGAWQLSNAPVFSLAPLDASLELFQEAGMEQIRQKSLALGDYLLELLDQIDDKPFEIITPTDHARRGSQFSLRGPEGTHDLYETLRASGVVCDYRNPRVIRLAPAPLYNSFEDVWTFCRILANALD
jgi:kynureninase